MKLPRRIYSYQLIQSLPGNKNNPSYSYGLYAYKGKKAFAKCWSGGKKDAAYVALQKEVQWNRCLSGIVPFVVPILEVEETENQYCVLYRYVSGSTADVLPSQKKALVMEKILKKISANTRSQNKGTLPVRPGWQLVISYPYFFVKALFSHYTLTGVLFRSLVRFIRYAPELFKEEAQTLAHRDLHPGNVIIGKSHTFVFDWCYAAWTVDGYDTRFLLATQWDDAEFRNALLNVNSDKKTDALDIWIATLLLSDSKMSKRSEKSVIQFLTAVIYERKGQLVIPTYPWIRKLSILLLTHWKEIFDKSKRAPHLPKKIGAYTLKKVLGKEKQYPYRTGLYRDDRNRYLLAKVWEGRQKTLDYFSLIHEARVNSILNDIVNRARISMPSHLKDIVIPKNIDVQISENRVIVLKEYFEGKTISEKEKDIEITYERIIEYFSFLSTQMTSVEKKSIGIRMLRHFLLLYPILVTFSLIRHPRRAGSILLATLLFVFGIPSFFRNNQKQLVHGDLHPGNILVSGSKLVILDTEQLRYSYGLYEYITSLESCRLGNQLTTYIRKVLAHFALKDGTTAQFIRSLFINCTIHNLSYYSRKESEERYLTLLTEITSQKLRKERFPAGLIVQPA